MTAHQDYLWATVAPRWGRRMKPPCLACDRIHSGADTRAVGRFRPAGPTGYQATVPGAPIRSTRAEAMRDSCAAHMGAAAREAHR